GVELLGLARQGLQLPGVPAPGPGVLRERLVAIPVDEVPDRDAREAVGLLDESLHRRAEDLLAVDELALFLELALLLLELLALLADGGVRGGVPQEGVDRDAAGDEEQQPEDRYGHDEADGAARGGRGRWGRERARRRERRVWRPLRAAGRGGGDPAVGRGRRIAHGRCGSLVGCRGDGACRARRRSGSGLPVRVAGALSH